MSFNKVILVGNLGRDPEMRYMPSGDAMATIAGTPSRWRSGVATAEPPFPNAPDR